MNARIEKSLVYFTGGKEALGKKDTKRGIKYFADAFYLRVTTDAEIDLDFYPFFLYQFSRYLLGKKRITITLPEGDMVSDLIAMTFSELQEDICDSPFNLDSEAIWDIYKDVHIDFPCQRDPKLLTC